MRTRMAILERSAEPTPCGAQRWLSIIGIGEDGVDGLSPVARQLIAAAELVVGGERHLTLADSLIKGARLTWPNPIEEAFPQILARRSEERRVGKECRDQWRAGRSDKKRTARRPWWGRRQE